MAADLDQVYGEQARKFWSAQFLRGGLVTSIPLLRDRQLVMKTETCARFLDSLQKRLAMFGQADLNGPAIAELINHLLDELSGESAEIIVILPTLIGILFRQDRSFAYWLLETVLGDPTMELPEHYGLDPQDYYEGYWLN